MDINGQTIDEFRADFNAAIAPLQEKYGVTITLGHITYYKEYFSSRLKVVNGTDAETTAIHNFDADVWKFKHLGLVGDVNGRKVFPDVGLDHGDASLI